MRTIPTNNNLRSHAQQKELTLFKNELSVTQRELNTLQTRLDFHAKDITCMTVGPP